MCNTKRNSASGKGFTNLQLRTKLIHSSLALILLLCFSLSVALRLFSYYMYSSIISLSVSRFLTYFPLFLFLSLPLFSLYLLLFPSFSLSLSLPISLYLFNYICILPSFLKPPQSYLFSPAVNHVNHVRTDTILKCCISNRL